MLHSHLKKSTVGLAVLFCLVATSANAVLFYSTGDPTYNSTAPTGVLANSGWQYEGLWGGFLGTPIAPQYFITAEHVGGAIGDTFVFGGIPYTTTAVFDDPQTDLRLWRICGTFPVYAPLYTATNEVGGNLVVFGRGTQRGAVVMTTNLFQVKAHGWQWGSYDGVQRWGENVVASIVNGDGAFGGSGIGEVLQANFDANGGPNECQLSVGDSAGAVFMKDGPTWKLAAINYAVTGPYSTSATGPGFSAAIFDEGGLYKAVGANWVLTPDLPSPQPGSFYSTRVSSRTDWIKSVLSAPLPADSQLTLQMASSPSGPYTDVTDAAIDDVSKTIVVPEPPGPGFYRLHACSSLQIKSIQLQNGNVVLTYE